MANDERPTATAHARAGERLLASAAAGAAVFASTMALAPWQLAVLGGWDAASAVAIIWVFVATGTKTSAETARMATNEDDSRAAADLLIMSAAVASLVAVGFGLLKAAEAHGAAKGIITAIAALNVALAAVQATFTLRYARLYYSENDGIDFNEDSAPDYRDFAYLAVTIGMTYQVPTPTSRASRSAGRPLSTPCSPTSSVPSSSP